MSFLGMGPFEILIVLLVAFIFLGPERMADAARTLGKWTSELRRTTAGVRAEMDDLITDDAPNTPTPTPPTRPTQTRSAAHANAPTSEDAQADAASADAHAPVAFRRAPAQPTPPAASEPAPKAAPTTDALPPRPPTEDKP